jgi:hypothetical protein
MNHPHDIDSPPGNSKQSAEIAVPKLPVVGFQVLVFWNQRASMRKVLEGVELLFHLKDESIRGASATTNCRSPGIVSRWIRLLEGKRQSVEDHEVV